MSAPQNIKNKNGFTLIELLLVMLIIVMISASSFAILSRFNRTQSHKIFYENMKNDLNFAKSNAASQVIKKCKSDFQDNTPDDPSDNYIFLGYRFNYTSNSYSIEEVCSRSISNPEIKTVNVPSGLYISAATLPDSILFRSLARGTNLTENRVITIGSSNGSDNKQIKIYTSGVIE